MLSLITGTVTTWRVSLWVPPSVVFPQPLVWVSLPGSHTASSLAPATLIGVCADGVDSTSQA